jgi:sugar lactone lactonase YvrE
MKVSIRNKTGSLRASMVVAGLVAWLSASTGCGGGGGGGGGGGDGSNGVVGGSVQTTALALSGDVSTIAGKPNTTDGKGRAARFLAPRALARDSGGNVYIADNCVIRKMDAAGNVSTLLGDSTDCNHQDGIGSAARFGTIGGIATDNTYLYVTEPANSVVRRVLISSPAVNTIAGTLNTQGHSDNSVGLSAVFTSPTGIAVYGGYLYVSDPGTHVIRRIALSGNRAVTTVAGGATQPGYNDDTGILAKFDAPEGLATDGTNLYVADLNNNRIRKILLSSGAVSTVAGDGISGAEDGTGTGARLRMPFGLACNAACANLYVTDQYAQVIRVIDTASSAVTTLAGADRVAGEVDGTGAGAAFASPEAVVTDGTSLFVADRVGKTIRKVTAATGETITYAGVAAGTDGVGAAASVRPFGLTTDGRNVYVADADARTIRKYVIATGEVTTVAGNAFVSGETNGTGDQARFLNPFGITSDGDNLYVADAGSALIRRIRLADYKVTTVADLSALAPGIVRGITTDGHSIYVSDILRHVIYKADIATGHATVFAGTYNVSGSDDKIGTAATFNMPVGLTTDGQAIYVADSENCLIRKVSINGAAVTTLSGAPGCSNPLDGASDVAKFTYPTAITCDGTNLYVGESRLVRKVSLANGSVDTVAGNPAVSGHADGKNGAELLGMSQGITTDGHSLFLSDVGFDTLRRIE